MMMITQVEATTCSAPSNLFKGPCMLKRNCQIACEKDGFQDGNCHGVLRRCICTKSCSGGSGGGGGGGGGGGDGGGGTGGDSDGGDGGGGDGGDGGDGGSGGDGGDSGDGGDAPPS
ncbi:hypothetical protein U1Q18_032035 [Sarracenia purpurea var. burkii]